MNTRPRGSTWLILLSALLLSALACSDRLDRVITADGLVVTGHLSSVQGGTISFTDTSPLSIGSGTGRIYLREGGSLGGAVAVSDGMLTVSGAGDPVPIGDVEMVIWSDPSYEATITLDVPAWGGWIPSGLEVDRGDMVAVSASGTVTMETGTCGPGGLTKYSTTTALFPGATNGALVLRVGEATPIAAGSLWSGPSPDSGMVFFAVNLPEERPSAVSGGVFTVSARRGRGPGEGSWTLFPVGR